MPGSPAVWTTAIIPGRIPSSPAAAHISSSTVPQAASASPPRSSRRAFHAKDNELAINHLKHAIRRHRDEDQFCPVLGLVYLEMGEEEKARRWMNRAEGNAQDGAMKSIYSSKIDNLIATSRRGSR